MRLCNAEQASCAQSFAANFAAIAQRHNARISALVLLGQCKKGMRWDHLAESRDPWLSRWLPRPDF